jgi:beta-fructofuranosidase
MLMYTSCGDSSGDPTGKGRWIQLQSIAIRKPGESEYAKYEGNPVISADDLPEGGDPYEFRDPYMWRCADGSYRALVANGRTSAEEGTRLLLFRSEDGLDWGGGKVLFEDERRIGVMWECPNFFPLDGKHILMASPMDMQAEEGDAVGSIRFPQGNNVCYITGGYDEKYEKFRPDADDADAGYYMYEPVDGGLDFYAPQTFETAGGRRVMIGWMQDPSMANLHGEDEFRIFGQMTVPRELTLNEGRLIQWPVSELEKYRQDPVIYRNISIGANDEAISGNSLKGIYGCTLEGIDGRALDLELEIRPGDVPSEQGGLYYREFAVRFAAGIEHYTEFRYDPERSVVTVDRSHSGQPDNISGKRTIRIRDRKGCLSIRMLIDRWSAEIFINNGEQVMSMTYYTDLSAEGIEFLADGTVTMDAVAYKLAK